MLSPLVLFSYRYSPNFNDFMWGCMFRSAQMLLIHTLLKHHSIAVDSTDRRFVDLLMEFTDDDNAKAPSTYSVLNMCLTGERYFHYSTGSFLGPHMASLIVKQVCSSASSVEKPSIEVMSLCHGAGGLRPSDIERLSSKGDGILILVSSKLGIGDSIEDDVIAQQEIVTLLESKHCVGILGGPKGRSCYIVDASAADSILSALDPHVLLEAPNVRPDIFPSNQYMQELTAVDPSIHTKIKIEEMDPCFAVGFYLSNPKEEFMPWRESLKAYTYFSLPTEPAGLDGEDEDGGFLLV